MKDIALVLSSGGARGLAHIGVIEELEAHGYHISSIAGCSMGALIGGVYAAGKLSEFREWMKTVDAFACFLFIPSRDVKPVRRTRQGDVQQPVVFPFVFFFQGIYFFADQVGSPIGFRRPEEQFAVRIRRPECFRRKKRHLPRVGQKHDGSLQPFGRVDGHNAHDVAGLFGIAFDFDFVLSQAVQKILQ